MSAAAAIAALFGIYALCGLILLAGEAMVDLNGDR